MSTDIIFAQPGFLLSAEYELAQRVLIFYIDACIGDRVSEFAVCQPYLFMFSQGLNELEEFNVHLAFQFR